MGDQITLKNEIFEILLHSNLLKVRKKLLLKKLKCYFFDRSRLKNYFAMQNDIYYLKHKYNVIEIAVSLLKIATNSKKACISSQASQALIYLLNDLNFWERDQKKSNENNSIQNISLVNSKNSSNIGLNLNLK